MENNTNLSKYEKLRIRATVYEDIVNAITEQEKNLHTDWRVIGKSDTQAKNWSTGELLWEDDEHTVPKYKDVYGTVELPDDELSEEAMEKRRVYLQVLDLIDRSL